MLPYTVVLNILLFGACVLTSAPAFLQSFVYNSIYILLVYYAFGSVALFIRNSYAANSDLFRRIGIMLPVFYLMNIAVMLGLQLLYSSFPLVDCPLSPGMYWWTVLYGCIFSTTLTFLNEGLSNWNNWKASLAETEKLRNAYQRSRIIGLKGQINPHFLFNCFNTLSGLIHDDEDTAERFLEEMTKVHRYLLRSDDELLVPLNEEIRFARSYLYLIQMRFGSAISANIDVHSSSSHMLVPPLSLHVILENIIYTNALSKSNPLQIEIQTLYPDEVHIRHSVHEKIIAISFEDDEGLDNLLNKYKLLNATTPIRIEENGQERTIILPLMEKKQTA
jgi:hypothetical protein